MKLSYFLLLLLHPLTIVATPFHYVVTNYGKLRGDVINVGGHAVARFLGVPFARPPVGKLRFQPPQPAAPWTGTVDAMTLSRACIQPIDSTYQTRGSAMWNPNTPQDEDCLYLNIWLPRNPRNVSVLVWFFGGGFYYGSPSLDVYNAAGLAAKGNVAVVNVNYRVAAFGFLYLGTSEVPGNMGLLDQRLALKWVKENIHHFGGNPDNVTLFGESAGAASVVAHMVGPGSRSLFNNGILQSGSLQNPWAMDRPARAKEKSQLLINHLGCGQFSNYWDVMECLLSLPPINFSVATWGPAFADNSNFKFMEFPLVIVSKDENFFSNKDAFDALYDGDYKKCNVIIGVNANEGTFWMIYYFEHLNPNEDGGKTNRDQFLASAKYALDREPTLYQNAALYLYGDPNCTHHSPNIPGQYYTDQLDLLLADYQFTCDQLWLGERLSKSGSNVYVYYFDHRISNNDWPKWAGVMHGYEIELIFGTPYVNTTSYSSQDLRISEQFIAYFTVFAKTGSPVLPQHHNEWKPWSGDKRPYITIKNTNAPKQGENLRREYCDMWDNVRDFQHKLSKVSTAVSITANSAVFLILFLVNFFNQNMEYF